MTLQGISVYGGRPVEIEWAEGRILRVREIEAGDRDFPFLSAGFLDMQVNGFHGSDYSLPDLSRDHIRAIIASLAGSGTTQHVPTIVTSPADRIVGNLRVLAKAMKEDPDIDAAVAGIHIEGPYISEEDGPRGAHDRNYVRDPDFEEFLDWQAAAGGRISMVTLAPERKGALDFIRKLAARGVVAAIGHTGADPETVTAAVSAGARISTHLGNGSYVTLPRLRNYIWEQLASDSLSIGMISDGFHLPPSVVKVFYKVKGPERTILVSDVALLGGMDPGIYKWGSLDVQVYDDGHLGLPGTTILAGAAHLLDWDIPKFMEFTGAPLSETIRLCTVNPARLLALGEDYGRLEAGSPANMVLFRHSGKGPLLIEKTVRAGRIVHEGKVGG